VSLLAELPESSATGRLGEIYGDIRRLGGVPMVALIFRHLATRPGTLEWAWDAMGPAWRSGLLQEAAWRVARDVRLDPIARIASAALPPLGVGASDVPALRAVLAAYNRANPENMLSVLCLARLLAGHREARALEPRAWTPPAAPGPLLPMVDVSHLSPEVSALMDVVAAPGPAGGPRVIQSLYRHIAQRPAFLALAVTLLRQRLDDGSIDRATAAVVARMNEEANRLADAMAAPPAPDPAVRAVLERFSGAVIPQMIVVGRLLEEAMPPR
jgi:hypothetical protein